MRRTKAVSSTSSAPIRRATWRSANCAARCATRPISFLNRVSLGLPTQAATAAEAHNRLMLTKALDLSAKLKQPVKLPLEPETGRAVA